MRLFSSSYSYNHPWGMVSLASWCKYPNPYNPNIHAVDILDRSIDNEGKLHTNRLITAEFPAPSWVRKILGDNVTFVNEHSEVDPIRKTMTLRAKNVSFSSFLSVEEICHYEADKHNPDITHFRQEAEINVFGLTFRSMCESMENVMLNRIVAQASNGKAAIEHTIDSVEEELADLVMSMGTEIEEFVTSVESVVDACVAEASDIVDKVTSVLNDRTSLPAAAIL